MRTLPHYDATLVDFSTNDYLGLSQHPALIEAACAYARDHGVGSTGSRLLSGNKAIFGQLEEQIAHDKGTEAALVFSSGYQANVSVIFWLCKEPCLIFFDKGNHASMYQGALQTGMPLIRYIRNYLPDLEKQLKKYQDDPRPKFVFSVTVYSMDGDQADIAGLIDLCRTYGAFLYLDEAHSTGLFGPRGYGLSTGHDFSNIDYVIMGTLGKALGCQGAYVACRKSLQERMIDQCPGFVYSTAPSPMVLAAAKKAWDMVPQLTAERERVLRYAKKLHPKATSPIVPVLHETVGAVLEKRAYCQQKGLWVSAIRPPTATPRLRISFSAAHTEEEVDRLCAVLSER